MFRGTSLRMSKVKTKSTKTGVCNAGKATVPLTSILFPSHFTDSFGKDAQARHLSNSTKVTHESRTPLVHHLIPFIFTVSRPGATDPVCQAPGLGSFRANAVPLQVDLRNRLVDFQCFGKGLWTKTMANNVKSENLQDDPPH